MPDIESRLAQLLAMKLNTIIVSSMQGFATEESEKIRLDPLTIPQFTDVLPIPDVFHPVTVGECGHITHCYAVDMSEFKQQVLPAGMPETTVYGYGGVVKDRETGETLYKRSSPGPTFEAVRGQTVQVQYANRLVRPICWL